MMVVKSPWCKEIRHLFTVRGEFQDDERRQFLVAGNLKGGSLHIGQCMSIGHQTSKVIKKVSYQSKNVENRVRKFM